MWKKNCNRFGSGREFRKELIPKCLKVRRLIYILLLSFDSSVVRWVGNFNMQYLLSVDLILVLCTFRVMKNILRWQLLCTLRSFVRNFHFWWSRFVDVQFSSHVSWQKTILDAINVWTHECVRMLFRELNAYSLYSWF